MSAPVTLLPPGEHLDLLLRAIAREAEAQRLLLDGNACDGSAAMLDASDGYRASWEVAPPRSFGRLVGMLKAAIIGGEPGGAVAYARGLVDTRTPTAAYASALVALVDGRDDDAAEAAAAMVPGGDAFGRAAAAITALATGDGASYRGAVRAIVEDFERRTEHLTGVAIADTALMLERLAAGRGLTADLRSALLPPA